jgi:trehalose 6-phosphate synthase/phosphatase
LLFDLVTTAGIRVDLVSGRAREPLQRWFGNLPLTLWAEHGFWHRSERCGPWHAAATVAPDWIARLAPILEQFVASTPGSRLEVKGASLAWHYRAVARDFGARQAHELRMLLGDVLSNQPLEVLEGKKVIEVRVRGVDKGAVARRVLAECDGNTIVVAIGDDRTDEDLFRALPAPHLSAAVGRSSSAAGFRLEDHRAVRRILREIVSDAISLGGVDHRSEVGTGALPSQAFAG